MVPVTDFDGDGTKDPIAVQIDLDYNGIFAGSIETRVNQRLDIDTEGLATFDHDISGTHIGQHRHTASEPTSARPTTSSPESKQES